MADIKKVLVVDDDTSLINFVKEYLPRVIKHELYVALTGEEALKVLEDKRPDVLLLDMQLPGIKGTEVLRIIRDKYPNTKVLVITTYDKQVKDIVAKPGVDGFFPKPFVLNEVISRLEEVLKATGDTTVTPVSLDEVKKRDDVMPKAKIMFIEREYLMPYLLPIADRDRPDDYPIEPYGEYEYENVYCQRDAIPALYTFRPDIVICATEVPEKEPFGWKSVSTAETIAKIMQSKYPPKAIIVHGTQQDISAHGIANRVDNSSVWLEKEDMYNYDEEKDKENAERLNKMLWRVCFKHGLVKPNK